MMGSLLAGISLDVCIKTRCKFYSVNDLMLSPCFAGTEEAPGDYYFQDGTKDNNPEKVNEII